MTATLLTTESTPSEQRREAGEHDCLGPLPRPGQPLPRSRDRLGRRAEPLVELRRDGLRPNLKVDLEEALQAPRLEVAGAREQLLTVAHERLGVEHRRVLEDANAGVQQLRVVEPLRRGAGPVVRVRRDEEPNSDAPTCRLFDATDHPA